MKVLVVEDHPLELKLAHLVLSAAGCEVSGVRRGEETLDAVRYSRPEVILLDMNMPGINGLAVALQLKSDPFMQDIKILGMTSYPERFSELQARSVGCDGYIVKPFSTRTLALELLALVEDGKVGSPL